MLLSHVRDVDMDYAEHLRVIQVLGVHPPE